MNELRKIAFKEILPIWQNNLWPGRESRIEPVSAIRHDGVIDLSLQYESPTFFGYFIDDELVGVNSCVRTGQNYFRSRGIYVFDKARGQGVGRILLQAVEDQALEECFADEIYLWSIPRLSALKVYTDFGFIPYTPEDSPPMEFGPNTYAMKKFNRK